MSITLENNSAHVILVNDDNSMTTTQKRRIMQRSKLVDDMWFLVNPLYNGIDLRDFTVIMEYVLPISRRYCNEILVRSPEMYNGYLKYVLPFDTELTVEHGDIEVQLTFIKVDLDYEGNPSQIVRKTSPATVTIVPISAWSDIIPDSALTALDQRLIKTDAQIRALDEMNTVIQNTKADNLRYDKNSRTLQLLAGNNEIGDKAVLGLDEDILVDGIPIVDFESSLAPPESGGSEQDNVVEF